MDRTRNPLIALAILTLTDPAAAARQVLAIPVPREVLWQGFALVVISGVVLSELAGMIALGTAEAGGPILLGPIGAVVLQAGILLLIVQATYRVGAAFGGQGGPDDTLKLLTWLQAVLIGVEAALVFLLMLLPGLVMIFVLVVPLWFLWVVTVFVSVLHGFRSRGLVFIGVLLTGFALLLALSMFLSAFGLIQIVPGVTP